MRKLASLLAAPSGHVPHIRPAYRILSRAHASVSGLLDAAEVLDEKRRSSNTSTKGRMSRLEVDVMRSALVLTSAGLDASMGRLVNDAGRALAVKKGTGARHQYEEYLKAELAKPNVGTQWRDAIVSLSPGDALLKVYLADRTKASLQGSGDLKSRVRNALGIPQSVVQDSDLERLDEFFIARNAISHDMDLKDPASNSIARHHRTVEDVVELSDRAFATAVLLIQGAADACRRAKV